MQIALIHDHFDADKLVSVTTEMQALGAPTIKAVWMEAYGVWVALEGCHRIRAAHALELTPIIEPVEYSDDEFELDAESGEMMQISRLCDEAYSATTLRFDA